MQNQPVSIIVWAFFVILLSGHSDSVVWVSILVQTGQAEKYHNAPTTELRGQVFEHVIFRN